MTELAYTRLFDPASHTTGYVYQDKITLAINVALATQRPILVSGPSGCGKSTLAEDVANKLSWDFKSEVVTGRTQAIDLFYRVDDLRKLQDARKTLLADAEYVSPGILWHAFDPVSAATKKSTIAQPATNTGGFSLPGPGKGVVVLLDEIDKADPDVPNSLLEAFGDYHFKVDALENVEVQAVRTPLLFVTTNNERRLPDAFIRRCVDLSIKLPDKEVLLQIAEKRCPAELANYRARFPNTKILSDVADVVMKTGSWSTAEYLDTLRAIFNLGVAESSENYAELTNYTVRKSARAVGI
jgi:MoxR-like ATPase